MLYQIACYAQEDLTCAMPKLTADEAIDGAYSFLGSHVWGAVHITAEGTTHGIFIARPNDQTIYTRDELVARLKQWKWR